MKKFLLIIITFLAFQQSLYSQTLVNAYTFPSVAAYNSFWGLTLLNDTFYIASSSTGGIYKVSPPGNVISGITTQVTFNQGLGWDGSGFWVARNASSNQWRFYKLNMSGQKLDSISIPSISGGSTIGIGGIAMQGNAFWFAVYFPDFTTYPFSYAYKMDLSTKQIVDTIPLRGKQIQGMAVKGDTLFYVNDNFQTEPERIYAYREAVGDTLFSFPCPDPDNDQDPRGLYWDGQSLWLIARSIGPTTLQTRTMYQYSLSGPGNPVIITSSNSLNFGNTIVGSPNSLNLTVNNTGTAKLIISSFNFTDAQFTISPNNTPDTINPSQSKNYNVTYNPTAFGNVSAQLQIHSNDVGTPVKTISLSGKGVYSGSYISISPGSLNYGPRRMNSLCGGYIDITNQGSQPLTINSVSFNSQRYRFDTTNVILPLTIDTQRTVQVRVWFNPNSTATFNDTMKMNTNAVNTPIVSVPLSGSGVNIPSALGDIMWDGNVPPNPNTTSNTYKVHSMREIPDVNGDMVNDVIVATANYWTICFNGNSSGNSDILWKFNTYRGSMDVGSVSDFENAMQIRDDVNGDGIKDVVIGCGGGNEHVYTISGRTGEEIWRYGNPASSSDGDINGVRTDKDFNNDGVKDVLVSASGEGKSGGRISVICLNGLNGQVIFNVPQTAGFLYDVQTSESGGAVCLTNNGGPYAVSGFNNSGQAAWNYGVSGAVWQLAGIPDINNDGVSDIVGFAGFNGTIFSITSDAGAQIWTRDLGASVDGRPLLVQDINLDGYGDLVFSGPRVLSRIDSKTSQFIWSTPLDNNYIHGVGETTDLTGDGRKEIIAGTQNSNFYVLSGDSGRILFQYSFGSATTNTVEKVAAINSLDANVSSELVAGSRQGRVVCFSGGPNGTVGINPITAVIPEKFGLSQNYPNPFNPVTKISFDLPKTSFVKLMVYDVTGRLIRTLVNNELQAGQYKIDFDGSALSSGAYFYRIDAGSFMETKRMLMIK